MRYLEPGQNTDAEAMLLTRRGCDLGYVTSGERPLMPTANELRRRWDAAEGIVLPGILSPLLPRYAEAVQATLAMMQKMRDGESLLDLLDAEPYGSRLAGRFELLAACHSEHDAQEIEKLLFDALNPDGSLLADELWMKASCLSFFEPDQSMRFRFSHGVEMFKDSEEDALREEQAAKLAEVLFPECAAIVENGALADAVAVAIGKPPHYPERLIYANAPHGGAQMHQDVERGHIGVVYAQLYGRTGWFALARETLLDEMESFLRNPASAAALAQLLPEARRTALLTMDRAALADKLEADDQGEVEELLNRCPAFARQLLERGHGYLLNAGDVILLPQQSTEICCWHAVFCLDDFPGHSLSFAIAG